MTVQHPFGCTPNCYGTLTAGGFSLNTWGWMVQNLTPLWYQRTYVGDNRVIPSAHGRLGFPRERDEQPFSLVFYVTGGYEDDGTPYADPVEGLELNLALLETNVFAPVTTGTGSRASSLLMPSGATRTANVQYNPLDELRPIEDPMLAVFRMTGVILEGRFA